MKTFHLKRNRGFSYDLPLVSQLGLCCVFGLLPLYIVAFLYHFSWSLCFGQKRSFHNLGIKLLPLMSSLYYSLEILIFDSPRGYWYCDYVIFGLSNKMPLPLSDLIIGLTYFCIIDLFLRKKPDFECKYKKFLSYFTVAIWIIPLTIGIVGLIEIYSSLFMPPG